MKIDIKQLNDQELIQKFNQPKKESQQEQRSLSIYEAVLFELYKAVTVDVK